MLASPPAHVERVGASQAHDAGIAGYGVTVAVLDSGSIPHPGLLNDGQGRSRLLAHYDAIAGKEKKGMDVTDWHGHGAHVAGLAVNSDKNTESGWYYGIAPEADLVIVRAFDPMGQGTYADVIRGIDWIVANQMPTAFVCSTSPSAPRPIPTTGTIHSIRPSWLPGRPVSSSLPRLATRDPTP